jgi:hypothetical protein
MTPESYLIVKLFLLDIKTVQVFLFVYSYPELEETSTSFPKLSGKFAVLFLH